MICVVFVAEAAAPVAAIGNSQFFVDFLLIAFLLPYGLISSELGTTYIGEGGIYDCDQSIWSSLGCQSFLVLLINYPLWLASLAVMTPELLTTITGIKFSTPMMIIVELILLDCGLIIFYPVSDSIWILNGAAVIKMVLAVLIGGLGLYVALTKGVANEFTLKSMLPTFDLRSLSFISVIIFNLLGLKSSVRLQMIWKILEANSSKLL